MILGDLNAEASFRSPMEAQLDYCFSFDYSIFVSFIIFKKIPIYIYLSLKPGI